MKKALIVSLCVIIFCGVLTGCSSSRNLKLDDFGIYEDGELVLESTDLESGLTSFDTLQNYDFEGRVLETKRGIKIGSSAREVAEAYKGITSSVLVTAEDITLEEYLDSGKAKEDGDYVAAFDLEDGENRYIINFHISGDVVTNITFLLS